MVYLQGHANFNEFWVTCISKLQSIQFYFYNFGPTIGQYCVKLHSIFTKFNQFQLAFAKLPNQFFANFLLASANFKPIFHTSISFQKTIWKGGWKVGKPSVCFLTRNGSKTFFYLLQKKEHLKKYGIFGC